MGLTITQICLHFYWYSKINVTLFGQKTWQSYWFRPIIISRLGDMTVRLSASFRVTEWDLTHVSVTSLNQTPYVPGPWHNYMKGKCQKIISPKNLSGAWSDFAGAAGNLRWARSGFERSALAQRWAAERMSGHPPERGAGIARRSAHMLWYGPVFLWKDVKIPAINTCFNNRWL